MFGMSRSCTTECCEWQLSITQTNLHLNGHIHIMNSLSMVAKTSLKVSCYASHRDRLVSQIHRV